jgi:hypothetical protein
MSSAPDPRDESLRASLPIARYAEIFAHVVHFGSERTADVVQRFGYSLDTWRAVDQAWTNGLVTHTPTDEPAKILAFSATFHQHRVRLAERQPPLESITNQVAPQTKAADKPTAAVSTGVPSFMLADAKRPAAAEGISPWAAHAEHVHAAPAPLPSPPSMQKTSPEPLPFVAGVSAEAALQSAVEYAQKVQGSTSPAPAASLGATNAIEENDISAIARRVVPFGGTSATPTNARPARDPKLTMEQHAALYVDLELHPEHKADILRRYGLTPAQHARIDAGWDAQLTLNPRLAAAWQQAASNYRSRLLGGS